MDAIGGQEMLLPALNPAEVWQESGRWDVMGDNMFRLKDRFGRDLCLGMTHEEVMTVIARGELRSYKQLPQIWYQIQTKFRDEPRPKSGLLRVRQFIMKDSYTFDMDQAGLDAAYDKHYEAYCRIFDRCGLEYTVGGSALGRHGRQPVARVHGGVRRRRGFRRHLHELRLLGQPGEGGVACPQPPARRRSRRRSRARGIPHARPQDHRRGGRVHRPARDLADEEPRAGGRRQAGAGAAARRSSAERNQFARAWRAIAEFRPAQPDEIREWFGAEAGSLGPVGVKNMPILADQALEGRRNMIAGANRDDYHLRHVTPGEDFQAEFCDLRQVAAGDALRQVRRRRSTIVKTVEIGHIFKLGYKYSESMGLRVLNADGKEVTPIMGSYGIGIERILCCAIELFHDKDGMMLPPVDRAVPGGGHAGEQRRRRAEGGGAQRSIDDCLALGLDALLDDRDERPGVKFKDADLIGIPFRITVGKKLASGMVELVERRGKKSHGCAAGEAGATCEPDQAARMEVNWAEVRAEFPCARRVDLSEHRHVRPDAAPPVEAVAGATSRAATSSPAPISWNGSTMRTASGRSSHGSSTATRPTSPSSRTRPRRFPCCSAASTGSRATAW